MNVLDVLEERGFVEQKTHEDELRQLFDSSSVTGYIGFDPTASSLHIGSLVPIMSLAHMQRCGHRPIALVGGGTGLVGDPSGKTEMRKILTLEKVEENVAALKKQLSRFLDFGDGKALMLNNADWLVHLNYISLLRDIGCQYPPGNPDNPAPEGRSDDAPPDHGPDLPAGRPPVSDHRPGER